MDRDSLFGSKSPGVYREEKFGRPRRLGFSTGVPVFLGMASGRSAPARSMPVMLSLWSQFEHHIGSAAVDNYLAYAVRGFFENGGNRCYVVSLADRGYGALTEGLSAIAPLNTIDLVCVPDLPHDRREAFQFQQMVVDHCQTLGDRFAILDSRPHDGREEVCEQWSEIDGKNGALYYPWVKVRAFGGGSLTVPPCGHVAGVFARTDQSRGVHKAPANEVLHGAVGLERTLTSADQDYLNPRRINCLRVFPGRGIRVWGARTLSGQTAWTYINVRRVFLTAVRWIEWNMGDLAFEPNDSKLWARIERELYTYFIGQFRAGAFKGRTPEEAFYVKCNAETNPPDLREKGQVVAEVGLAPALPYEFVVVRLIHGAKGVTISGPETPN